MMHGEGTGIAVHKATDGEVDAGLLVPGVIAGPIHVSGPAPLTIVVEKPSTKASTISSIAE